MYARKNLETWIPKAVEILIEMLGKPGISTHMKDEIHAALLERANDPTLKATIVEEKPLDNIDWGKNGNPFLIRK